jgi:RNA chaperone Hfq
MNETIKSENEFFAAQIADAHPVAIFLINGNRLQGTITAADEHCLLLEGHVEAKYSGLCLVMKTAIASVVTTASKSPTRADTRTLHSVQSPHRQ